MKELSIEQKAKRYDEAINKAKDMLNYKEVRQEDMEYLFPELKESEDERIRKELIDFVKTRLAGFPQCNKYLTWLETQGVHANFRNCIHIGDKVTRNEDGILVNLSQLNRVAKKDEKQGEQKPADKVEHQFKVGDWIIFNGLVLYIKEVVKWYYRTISKSDIPNSYDWDIDKLARLWTIQDAKDGDVLVDGDNNIGIYKEIEGICWHSYIYLGCDNRLYGFSIGGSHIQNNTKPATKEQRDLLFQKMKDAGYEWNAEKKELRRLSISWMK